MTIKRIELIKRVEPAGNIWAPNTTTDLNNLYDALKKAKLDRHRRRTEIKEHEFQKVAQELTKYGYEIVQI